MCTSTFTSSLVVSLLLIVHVSYGIGVNKLSSLYNTKLSSNVLVRAETLSFMQYAWQKMGSIKCLTFIWDSSLDADLIEALGACPISVPICSAYKYQVYFEEDTNITMIKSTLSAGYERQCDGYIIVLKRKEKILQLLQFGDEFDLINTRARFLIWYKGNDKVFEMNGIWSKVTNVIFFHSSVKRRSIGVIFTIRELIWPISLFSTRMRVRVIEFWAQDEKHFIYNQNQEWFHDNSNDLRETTLKILVLEHPPGVTKYVDADGQTHFGGTEIEIIKELSSSLHFNYEMKEIELSNSDIIYNYPRLWANLGLKNVQDSRTDTDNFLPNDTKSYFAAASRLITGEGADIAIGSFFVLQEYLDYLDMSIPLDVACTSFLTPIPSSKPKYLALILPFQFKLWVSVIVTCFLIGPLVLHLLTSFCSQYKREHRIFRNPILSIFTSFSLMSQVPLCTWPKFWPIRWFIGWYWLFWVCVTLAYRASMVAFLTIPLSENPIDNLHDLQESNLRIGSWGIELYQLFTKTYADHEINADQKKLAMKYELIENVDVGISMVAGKKFALYENVRSLQFIKMTRNLSSNGSPTMRLMKQCVALVHIGFAYQKHSALTLTFNRKIRRFQESGLLIKWRKELVLKRKELNSENDDIVQSEDEAHGSSQKVLTIHELQGCFFILVLGLSISSMVFLGEFVFRRFWHYHPLPNLEPVQQHIMKRLLQLRFIALVDDGIYKEFTKLGERKPIMEKKKLMKCRKKIKSPFPFTE